MQNLMVKLKLSFPTNEIVYGTDPLLIQNSVQSKYLFDMMNNSINPISPFLTPYLIPKPIPIYNILGTSLRGSYGWSKGYSMFLKHMFKPTIPKEKDKDNLKENGNQNEGELNEGELNEESRVFTENQQENDWEMKRSTINLKGVFEKRLFENKKVLLICIVFRFKCS